jgi:enoyl-CoA hydratase/carnithine racemase
MTFENIQLKIEEDGVARLLLNRPDLRNAMTPAMGEEVREAVRRIDADETVRVVVVRGAGRAFCSGADLADLAQEAGLREDRAGLGGERNFYRHFLSLGSLRVPTIAAINGHAIGAGLCFALGADLRVMHERAKLGMTFVKLGIHPGMGGTWTLPRLVGPALAAELFYTGRLIEAPEALQRGLVNRVAGEDFDAVVDELARQVRDSAPLAVRAVKETLRGSEGRTLEEALEVESRAQAATFRTRDAAEGIAAIVEKRPSRFEGL